MIGYWVGTKTNQNLASLVHKLWVWQCYEVVPENGAVEPSQGKLSLFFFFFGEGIFVFNFTVISSWFSCFELFESQAYIKTLIIAVKNFHIRFCEVHYRTRNLLLVIKLVHYVKLKDQVTIRTFEIRLKMKLKVNGLK